MDAPRLPRTGSGTTLLSGVHRMPFGSLLAKGTVGLADVAAEVGLAIILGAIVMLLPLRPYDTGEQVAIAANESAVNVGENLLTCHSWKSRHRSCV